MRPLARGAVIGLVLCLNGCAGLARSHCETVYGCEPVPYTCSNEDLVIICTEDRLGSYSAWTNWFGDFLSTLARALP
jgi:hypothetical protein